MLAPQFLSVNGGDTKLSDIKPIGTNIPVEGELAIQILTSNGTTDKTYYWWDLPEEEMVGWHDNTDTPVDATFKAGQGLWVYGTNSDTSLQFSGLVAGQDITVLLCKNFTALGNPYPVDVKLSEILPEGSEIPVEGELAIQLLTSNGATDKTYYWWNLPEEEMVGWHDNTDTPVDDTFTPGQGLWVYSTSDTNQYLRFPAPEGI